MQGQNEKLISDLLRIAESSQLNEVSVGDGFDTILATRRILIWIMTCGDADWSPEPLLGEFYDFLCDTSMHNFETLWKILPEISRIVTREGGRIAWAASLKIAAREEIVTQVRSSKFRAIME